MDAANFGSRAHRLRNFWSNLGEPTQLAAAIRHTNRPEGRVVKDILLEGREEAAVSRPDRVPWYPCNYTGEDRFAWPTLMAYGGSYNFRPGKPGAVWDNSLGRYDEPTAVERERAMGYCDQDTAAEGVTEQQRRAMLGRSMDASTTQALFGMAKEWWDLEDMVHLYSEEALLSCTKAVEQEDQCCTVLFGMALDWWLLGDNGEAWNEVPDTTYCYAIEQEGSGIAGSLVMGAEVTGADHTQMEVAMMCEESVAEVLGSKEIYEDEGLMQYLESRTMPTAADLKERDRIQHRAKRFVLKGEVLKRKLLNGQMVVVPKPEERPKLVSDTHEKCGHFGIKRMMSQLRHGYWWHGMKQDVRKVVSECTLCDRARVSFAGLNPKMQSLPMQGLFYRWHVDLATKLPTSNRGNTCIMIMIDAFSKVLEVYPIPEKTPEHTRKGFLEQVIGRYGAPAQAVTDRGTEFQGVFADLLMDYTIDHTPTTAGNPQSNGQAERAVQVVKRSLKKMCEAHQQVEDWEEFLPNITLGYNTSIQAATGYAPYTLVYGVAPVIPAARRERLLGSIDFDNMEGAAQDVMERATMMRENAVMAGSNQLIAQRRDQLTYARKRDGTYLPKVKIFKEGDYVYIRTSSDCVAGTGLALAVEPRVLRVTATHSNGTVEVVGKSGGKGILNARNLTLCHNPGVDGEIDWTLAKPADDFPCSVCNSPLHWGALLMCDGCGLGFHLWCHQPALTEMPVEGFICTNCTQKGITLDDVDKRQQETNALRRQEEAYKEFRKKANPTAAQKRREKANEALHGRLVRRLVRGATRWGKVLFKGRNQDPPFIVVSEDGTTEECGNSTIARRKEFLQAVGMRLPRGVTIPDVTTVTVAQEVPLEKPPSCDPYNRITAKDVAELFDQIHFSGEMSVAGSRRTLDYCAIMGHRVVAPWSEADLVVAAPDAVDEVMLQNVLHAGHVGGAALIPKDRWTEVLDQQPIPQWLGMLINERLLWVMGAAQEGFVWVVCFKSLRWMQKLTGATVG